MSSNTLPVPSIYSPFPAAIHPRHTAIEHRTTAWANSFRIGPEQLRRSLTQQQIGTFAARILPEGREEVVQILADFVIWLFGVDDGHCEDGDLGTRPGDLASVLSRLLRIAQNPEVPIMPKDPLAEGLRDLRSRIDRHATPAQATRWVDAPREYFLAVVWEAAHRHRKAIPSLSDYVLMRLYDGATTVVMPLLEMAHGYELTPDERDDKRVRAAAETAYFLLCWDNDILSFHKESRTGRYYLNALPVLQREYNLSLGKALTTAIAQRDRVLGLYLRLRDHLLHSASPQLRQYLTSLNHYIRAFQDWGISSSRYTCPDDPAQLPTRFRETPTDDSADPLPIPAISWWWDMLPGTDTSRESA